MDILAKPQRALWDELSAVPEEFVLYGGTAIALHLGHRPSVDFALFANRSIDPEQLADSLPFLADATILQNEKNTLTAIADREGPVQLSFFGVPDLQRLAPPRSAPDNGLKVASLLDLAGAKASVVQARGEAKDCIDIDALMTKGGIDLALALAAAKAIYGPRFNPHITLKALSYFDDGNLRKLPDDMKERIAMAVRGIDLDRLPTIGQPQTRSPGWDIER